MIKKRVHSAISLFLLTILLIVQLGANFCHNEACHALKAKADKGLHIEKQADHCSICSLHFFHDLFCLENTHFNFDTLIKIAYSKSYYSNLFTYSDSPTGRAPPIF